MASSPTAIPVAQLIHGGKLLINDGYRAKNSELSSEGLPFARAGNIDDGFHFEGADCFPEEDLNKVGYKVSEPGDVVFTSKGTVGRFAFVREDTQRFVYSPQLCFWRSLDPKTIDARFLYFWMHGPEFYDQYKRVAGQTDMAEYVSLRNQRAMEITLPTLAVQQSIAKVLGDLDDKIHLLREISRTLEDVARAVFKAWFIDFEPVRAKAAGASSFRGMSQAIFDSLPDTLESSELGEIPRAWRGCTLAELIDVNPSRPLKKGALSTYLGMSDVPIEGPTADSWIKREFTSGMRFRNDDILIARITPCLENGKTAWVDFLQEQEIGWGSTEFIVLGPKDATPAAFIYCLARSERFREFAIKNMTGTSGRQRVDHSSIASYRMVRPATAILEEFGRIGRPIFKRITANRDEIALLSAMRDALLQRLVSGELEAPSLEALGLKEQHDGG